MTTLEALACAVCIERWNGGVGAMDDNQGLIEALLLAFAAALLIGRLLAGALWR